MKYLGNSITEKRKNWWFKTLAERYTDFVHSANYADMVENPEKYQEAVRKSAKAYAWANTMNGHLRKVHQIANDTTNEELIIQLRQKCTKKTFLAIMQNI